MRYILILFAVLFMGCNSASVEPKVAPKADINQYAVMAKAIDANDKEKLQELLESGFDVNSKNDANSTIVMYSLKKKHTQKLSKILINHGANLDAKDLDVLASLVLASDFDNDSLAQTIVSNLDEKRQEYVYAAIKYGYHQMFNFLLDNGYKITLKLSKNQINMYIVNAKYKELQENLSTHGFEGIKLFFMSKRAQAQLVKILDNLYEENNFTDKQKEKIISSLQSIGENHRAYTWFESMKENKNDYYNACILSANIGKTDKKACHNLLLNYIALGDKGKQSWAYLLLQRYDDAIEVANIAIQKNKKYYTYSNMGHAYLLQGKKEKAYEAYKNYFIKLKSVTALYQMKEDFDMLRLNYPDKKVLIDEAYEACIKMDTLVLETKKPTFRALIWRGEVDGIRELLKRDTPTQDELNQQLRFAAFKGHTDIVKLFLENGADINSRSEMGETALYNAAKAYNIKTVKYLIDNGADVNIAKEKEYTVLNISLQNKELRELLVSYGDRYTNKLQYYIASLNTKKVQSYFEKLSKEGKKKYSSFIIESSIDLKNYDLLIYMLKLGYANGANKFDWTYLYRASEKGDLQSIKLLLKYGADINKKAGIFGYTPLYGAIEYADIEIVKFLIKNGADINIQSRSDSSLIHAIRYGKTDIAKLLIDLNVKQDSVNFYNKTALDIAKEKKNEVLIKLLL